MFGFTALGKAFIKVQPEGGRKGWQSLLKPLPLGILGTQSPKILNP